jgi:hypothetical protein
MIDQSEFPGHLGYFRVQQHTSGEINAHSSKKLMKSDILSFLERKFAIEIITL